MALWLVGGRGKVALWLVGGRRKVAMWLVEGQGKVAMWLVGGRGKVAMWLDGKGGRMGGHRKVAIFGLCLENKVSASREREFTHLHMKRVMVV